MSPVGLLLATILVCGLIAGKAVDNVRQEARPDVAFSHRQRDKLRRCAQFGADCKLYACYRTSRRKFICNEE